MSAALTNHPTWGTYSLADKPGAWQIGPLSLWIERTSAEWIVTHQSGDDPLDMRASYESGWSEEPPESATRIRCAAGSSNAMVHVCAALADRAVVVKPEQPFILLADDETTFYIGSQLWVSVHVGEPARKLIEMPSFRPSDTWFGPSTREGELCYASRTRARMHLSELDIYPARALTPVRLINHGSDPLTFERLKVPIAYLGLYVDDEGRHWTQGLTVERGSTGAEVECRVESALPPAAGELHAIAGPRRAIAGVFKRALHALIG